MEEPHEDSGHCLGGTDQGQLWVGDWMGSGKETRVQFWNSQVECQTATLRGLVHQAGGHVGLAERRGVSTDRLWEKGSSAPAWLGPRLEERAQGRAGTEPGDVLGEGETAIGGEIRKEQGRKQEKSH